MRIFRPSETTPPDDLPLVRAVDAEDAAAVRERLAAGAFADSCNETGHTVLMLAAIAGHQEIFELLLDAGADPYFQHSGLGPTALDFAAMMGGVDIIDSWVRRGLQVSLADGVGNTPLMAAAAAGHVEVVRRLLAAGADVHGRTVDRITAHALARHEGHNEVAAVLSAAGGTTDPAGPLGAGPATFGLTPADRTRFRRAARRLAKALGRPAKPWEGHAEVYAFESVVLGREERHRHEEARRLGFHLVRSTLEPVVGPATYLLFPTNDKYAVIHACGTDGGRCELSTARIMSWLRDLEQSQPFALTGCGPDFVAGQFLGPVRDAAALARSVAEFCPDAVDQGSGTAERLAEQLVRTREFVLWWD